MYVVILDFIIVSLSNSLPPSFGKGYAAPSWWNFSCSAKTSRVSMPSGSNYCSRACDLLDLAACHGSCKPCVRFIISFYNIYKFSFLFPFLPSLTFLLKKVWIIWEAFGFTDSVCNIWIFCFSQICHPASLSFKEWDDFPFEY